MTNIEAFEEKAKKVILKSYGNSFELFAWDDDDDQIVSWLVKAAKELVIAELESIAQTQDRGDYYLGGTIDASVVEDRIKELKK